MTQPFVIVPIVEGQGEVAAVPLLLRRITFEIDRTRMIEVRQPIRVGRDKVMKDGELERYVEFAARVSRAEGAVLLLLEPTTTVPPSRGAASLRGPGWSGRPGPLRRPGQEGV